MPLGAAMVVSEDNVARREASEQKARGLDTGTTMVRHDRPLLLGRQNPRIAVVVGPCEWG